jgi:thiamine transport system substrate-binding protein
LAGGSYWQVEFVGVLRGTKVPDLARAWIDFMLGPEFQADIPLQMWVYPAREDVPLPEVFDRFTSVPESVVSMSPEQIEGGRERWLVEWTDAVLR